MDNCEQNFLLSIYFVCSVDPTWGKTGELLHEKSMNFKSIKVLVSPWLIVPISSPLMRTSLFINFDDWYFSILIFYLLFLSQTKNLIIETLLCGILHAVNWQKSFCNLTCVETRKLQYGEIFSYVAFLFLFTCVFSRDSCSYYDINLVLKLKKNDIVKIKESR